MAKLAISPSTVAVNTIQLLDDVVVGQATSLKVAFDKAALDGKTYINDTLIAELNGDNGSKKIGHDSPNIAADNVNEALEEVYAAIASTVLGEIPDNSIPNLKLAADIKVGSLATLTTTVKSSVVGAINEIDAYVEGVPEQADTIEANLNILRTAKVTTGSNVALAVDTDGTFDMTRNGNILTIIPNVTNTGAMTVTVDGQTARAIQKANDAGTLVALEAGDIKQNVPVQLVLQTSGTPVFIYAPKVGAIKYGIQDIGLKTNATTLTTVAVSVSGKGILKTVFPLGTGAFVSHFVIDGVRYPTTGSYTGVNGISSPKLNIPFNVSLVVYVDSITTSGCAYTLNNNYYTTYGVGTSATMTLRKSVVGKGRITDFQAVSNNASLKIDTVYAIGSETTGLFSAYNDLYIDHEFSQGYEIRQATASNYQYKSELF